LLAAGLPPLVLAVGVQLERYGVAALRLNLFGVRDGRLRWGRRFGRLGVLLGLPGFALAAVGLGAAAGGFTQGRAFERVGHGLLPLWCGLLGVAPDVLLSAGEPVVVNDKPRPARTRPGLSSSAPNPGANDLAVPPRAAWRGPS